MKLKDKFSRYLMENPDGANSRELTERVLGITNASDEQCFRLIKVLAEDLPASGDMSICFDGTLWIAKKKIRSTSSSADARTLDSLGLCVAAIQKNAGSAESPVMRIALCQMTGEKLVSTNSWDLASPGFEKSAEEIASIIHNQTVVFFDAAKEVPLLKKAFRAGSLIFPYIIPLSLRDWSAKLFPELEGHSLEELSDCLKLKVRFDENPVVMLQTYAEIYLQFAEKTREWGVQTLEDLQNFIYESREPVDFSGFSFDRTFLVSLPRTPGVYRMYDKNDSLIYIGMSRDLKNRLNSYFYTPRKKDPRVQRILASLHSIEIHHCGSSLDALLSEYRQICIHNPALNTQRDIGERCVSPKARDIEVIFALGSNVPGCLELFLVKGNSGYLRIKIKETGELPEEVENTVYSLFFSHQTSTQHPVSGLFNCDVRELELLAWWFEKNSSKISYIDVTSAGSKENTIRMLRDFVKNRPLFSGKYIVV